MFKLTKLKWFFLMNLKFKDIIHGLIQILLHVEKAIDMLLHSEKPIILAGGGTIISSAFAELQAVAETLMLPVVTTFKGKGAFPETIHYH